MRPLAALVGLAALAACAPKSPPNTLDARMSGTFNWMCAGGTPATVTFHDDAKLADLTIEGQTIQLLRMPTSRGWLYQFGSTQISGSPDRMQISSQQHGNLDCRPN